MEFRLWNNASPDNAINKVLSGMQVIEIFLKRDVDISSPEIVLRSITGVDFRAFNYAEIPALGRKYFIRSIDSLSNTISRLNLECDVIETYKGEILASHALMNKVPAMGDFGQMSLNFTGDIGVSNYESNVTLEPSTHAIFNVLRWI